VLAECTTLPIAGTKVPTKRAGVRVSVVRRSKGLVAGGFIMLNRQGEPLRRQSEFGLNVLSLIPHQDLSAS
jgi:hypothetical protein